MSKTNDKSNFKLESTNSNENNLELDIDKKKIKRNTSLKVFKCFTNSYIEEKTFFQYILYVLSYKKKNKFFKFYQDFRIKLISEEHLTKNHLIIYNLLKITEKKDKLEKVVIKYKR